ncbi:Uncharacterised protein [Mycobacteroides abscessus subsp. abscessus]|nr:Uncharacterised protein [Mycobacteroides abscessus subsp. abscessus]
MSAESTVVFPAPEGPSTAVIPGSVGIVSAQVIVVPSA